MLLAEEIQPLLQLPNVNLKLLLIGEELVPLLAGLKQRGIAILENSDPRLQLGMLLLELGHLIGEAALFLGVVRPEESLHRLLILSREEIAVCTLQILIGELLCHLLLG